MRGRSWAAATVAVVLLASGCGGEVDLADRDSIDQFEVPALEPTAEHPCDLLSDTIAVDLGILHEGGSGSAQSDANCFYTNRVDASVDVRVDVLDDELATGNGAEETAVATVVSAAFTGQDEQEYTSVEGYPGVTTAFPDSCNLSVATSDEHELFVQVSADNACETAVVIAETVIANAPEL